jgi:hypothetical protein
LIIEKYKNEASVFGFFQNYTSATDQATKTDEGCHFESVGDSLSILH